MQEIDKIIDLIDISIKEDADIWITSWNIIADSYDKEVDKYRGVIAEAKNWLENYTKKIISDTGISNLKIKYTSASGYFIEVSKSQVSKVPDTFVHKQTLVNAARYITAELKEFEEELIQAEWSLSQIEYDLFQWIRDNILEGFISLKKASYQASYIDFITTLSFCAYEYNYICPKISSEYNFEVLGWRHPVIETIEWNFISNDFATKKNRFCTFDYMTKYVMKVYIFTSKCTYFIVMTYVKFCSCYWSYYTSYW